MVEAGEGQERLDFVFGLLDVGRGSGVSGETVPLRPVAESVD